MRTLRSLIESEYIELLNQDDLKSKDDIEYWEYDEGEKYSITPPTDPEYRDVVVDELQQTSQRYPATYNIDNLTDESFNFEVSYRPPFVAELEDVTIFGPSGIARTNRREFPLEQSAGSDDWIVDFLYHSLIKWGRIKTYNSIFNPNDVYELDVAASMIGFGGGVTTNYAHWLIEEAPRLRGIEHYYKQTGDQPTILIPSSMPPWQKRFMRNLGFEDYSWRVWEGEKVSIRKYVQPMFPKEEFCASNLRWIRDRILQNTEYRSKKKEFGSRVFLSRSGVSRKKIINQDEVIAMLSEYGFEIYQPETLSFAEDVALYNQADILVSSNGAGLTNMIYSDGASIVELMQPEHHSPWYYQLAQILGLDYYSLFGLNYQNKYWQPVDKNHLRNRQYRDFQVSVEDLENIILSITSETS